MKVVGTFAALATSAEAGGTLAVTWEDCGAKHATVTDVQPTTVNIGTTETISGTATLDEDITAAHFVATIKAAGVKIASCEGDATADIVCKMPLNAGQIVVKQQPLPIKAGTITIPAEITTASVIPASLAKIDAELRATEQNGEDAVCMNIHTAKQDDATLASTGGKMSITWEDCGDASTHGTITDVQPTEITIGEAGTITGTGSIDEDISGGSFTIQMTASLGIKETYTGEVCEAKEFSLPLNLGTVSWAGMDCPVAAGSLSAGVGFTMASSVPAALAKADVSVSAIDQNGDKALCMTAHMAKEFTGADCSGATCASVCACANSKCSSQVDACLGNSACASAQSCVMACSCGDVACAATCAASSGSSLANDVISCLSSSCTTVV